MNEELNKLLIEYQAKHERAVTDGDMNQARQYAMAVRALETLQRRMGG